MDFSKQEYWSGLPFPPPGDLPKPGIEPSSAGRFFNHLGHHGSTPPPSKKKKGKKHMVSFWLLAFHTGVECILTSAVIGRAVVMERKQTSMSLTVSAVSHVFSPLAVLLVVFCVSFNTQRTLLPVNCLFHSLFSEASRSLCLIYLFWVKFYSS